MYDTISFLRFSSSILPPPVSAFIVQLLAFQELYIDQSQDNPRTSPSATEPSSLQLDRGFAITIQFPHGANGHTAGGGRFPETAGGQKQKAAHTHNVSVGVA
jgi:hypothetical protein